VVVDQVVIFLSFHIV